MFLFSLSQSMVAFITSLWRSKFYHLFGLLREMIINFWSWNSQHNVFSKHLDPSSIWRSRWFYLNGRCFFAKVYHFRKVYFPEMIGHFIFLLKLYCPFWGFYPFRYFWRNIFSNLTKVINYEEFCCQYEKTNFKMHGIWFWILLYRMS